jgi:hypothetical protein
MTKNRQILYDSCAVRLVIVVMLIVAQTVGSFAQLKQSLKITIRVSAGIGGLGTDAQQALAGQMSLLSETFRGRAGSADSLSLAFGFSISAYENISVLLSYAQPAQEGAYKNEPGSMQIVCGYLNDGTTNFRRAAFSAESPVHFRLRENHLLSNSMQPGNLPYEAYVFFLVNQRKGENSNGIKVPVATVTVEYL